MEQRLSFITLGAKDMNKLKQFYVDKFGWGGYSGYVKDIEDNLWEVAYNPFLEMDSAGNVLTTH